MPPTISAIVLAAVLSVGAPAHAAQICAWMTEKAEEEDFRSFELWLESDEDIQIYYQMAGRGVIEGENHAHSPGSGTFVLHPGEPDKPWGFGVTFVPPGEIDIVAEIHETPKDIFSDDPSPLLTEFVFRRAVPEGETAPPPVFAQRQCRTVQVPK